MPLIPIRSSNLAAVGYDPQRTQLRIRFRSGRTYDYFAVPLWEYAGLMLASSHGKYFHREIRNRYGCLRVF
jgi:hypothetical protein